MSSPLSGGLRREIWFEIHETTWLTVSVKLNILHFYKNLTANILWNHGHQNCECRLLKASDMFSAKLTNITTLLYLTPV